MNICRTRILYPASIAFFSLSLSSAALGQIPATLPDRESGAARAVPPAADTPMPSSSVAANVAAIHSQNLQRAADGYEESNVSAFTGRDIQSGDQELATVHDVIVDKASGRITHIVAASGGMVGAGRTLRLVPIDQLTLSDESFTTKLDQKAFEALAKVSVEDLKTGQLTAARGGMPLSEFGDKKIRAGQAKVGELTDIVLDFKNGLAFAVVKVEGEFAGTEGEFLVPFERLQLTGGDADSITAKIDRADFAHVQPEASGMQGSPARPNPEQRVLSPTGRADPGSDAPRHEGRDFGAAQNDSAVGGAAAARPTQRENTAAGEDPPSTKR